MLEGTGTTLSPGLMDRLAYVPSGTVVWIMLLSLVLVLSAAALLLYMRGQPFSPDHLYVNRVAAKEAGMIIEKREES